MGVGLWFGWWDGRFCEDYLGRLGIYFVWCLFWDCVWLGGGTFLELSGKIRFAMVQGCMFPTESNVSICGSRGCYREILLRRGKNIP